MLIQLSRINTFLTSKFFQAMNKQADGIMFKYLNSNKNTKHKDSANKKKIHERITNFKKKIKILKNDHSPSNQYNNEIDEEILQERKDQKYNCFKNDFIDDISKILENNIKSIKIFFDKQDKEIKNKYMFNESLNLDYLKQEIRLKFEEYFENLNGNDINQSIETILDNNQKFEIEMKSSFNGIYDLIKDEIYFDTKNENSNKTKGLFLLNENRSKIENYKKEIKNLQNSDNEICLKLLTGPDCPSIPSASIEFSNEDSDSIVKSFKDNKLISKKSKNDYVKKIIDKVKTWEMDYFNTKTSSIDDIWIHMTTREFGLNYKCKLSFQYESKEFLVVINEQTNDKLRRTLKSLKEKTVNIRRDHDFDEKGTFLNPMIVWLSKNTDDSLDNVYQLIKTIFSMISTNFFVFLFIEKYDSVENKDLSEKYENSLKNLFSSIETIDSKIWNTIATVFIEGNGIGLNVRKSYEIYWSKFFEIDLFYSVNEKIDKFFEYDHTLEDFMANEETAVRALDFMARVFFQGLFDTGQSISDTDMDLHIKYLLTSLYREKVIDSEKYSP